MKGKVSSEPPTPLGASTEPLSTTRVRDPLYVWDTYNDLLKRRIHCTYEIHCILLLKGLRWHFKGKDTYNEPLAMNSMAGGIPPTETEAQAVEAAAPGTREPGEDLG